MYICWVWFTTASLGLTDHFVHDLCVYMCLNFESRCRVFLSERFDIWLRFVKELCISIGVQQLIDGLIYIYSFFLCKFCWLKAYVNRYAFCLRKDGPACPIFLG